MDVKYIDNIFSQVTTPSCSAANLLKLKVHLKHLKHTTRTMLLIILCCLYSFKRKHPRSCWFRRKMSNGYRLQDLKSKQKPKHKYRGIRWGVWETDHCVSLPWPCLTICKNRDIVPIQCRLNQRLNLLKKVPCIHFKYRSVMQHINFLWKKL